MWQIGDCTLYILVRWVRLALYTALEGIERGMNVLECRVRLLFCLTLQRGSKGSSEHALNLRLHSRRLTKALNLRLKGRDRGVSVWY